MAKLDQPGLFYTDLIANNAKYFATKAAVICGDDRLTWAEYEDHFRRIGFRTLARNFRETPLDEEFYGRFEGVLGRYPRTDLARDFFQVVLEKPEGRAERGQTD